MNSSDSYTTEFFDNIRKGARSSAQEIVPLAMKCIRPKRVVDIGCGTGEWLSVFNEHGAEVFGFDGDYVDRSSLRIPRDRFRPIDLTQPMNLNETFDLAVCLEVAEHIPATCAGQLVASLTALAPVIMFSAAVPNQGGIDHVNEQWQSYWVSLFAKEDFIAVDFIRPRIWDNPHVWWWYAQNLILYVKRDRLPTYEQLSRTILEEPSLPLSVVHPRMYLGMCYSADPSHMSLRTAMGLIHKVAVCAIKRRLGSLAKGHPTHDAAPSSVRV